MSLLDAEVAQRAYGVETLELNKRIEILTKQIEQCALNDDLLKLKSFAEVEIPRRIEESTECHILLCALQVCDVADTRL